MYICTHKNVDVDILLYRNVERDFTVTSSGMSTTHLHPVNGFIFLDLPFLCICVQDNESESELNIMCVSAKIIIKIMSTSLYNCSTLPLHNCNPIVT